MCGHGWTNQRSVPGSAVRVGCGRVQAVHKFIQMSRSYVSALHGGWITLSILASDMQALHGLSCKTCFYSSMKGSWHLCFRAVKVVILTLFIYLDLIRKQKGRCKYRSDYDETLCVRSSVHDASLKSGCQCLPCPDGFIPNTTTTCIHIHTHRQLNTCTSSISLSLSLSNTHLMYGLEITGSFYMRHHRSFQSVRLC